jgi:hypothetical protein
MYEQPKMPAVPVWIVCTLPEDEIGNRLGLYIRKPFRLIPTTLDRYQEVMEQEVSRYTYAGLRVETALWRRDEMDLKRAFPEFFDRPSYEKQTAKLCYISEHGPTAYFTTAKLWGASGETIQWGDDWNDAPFEHNAGTPYACTAHDVDLGHVWMLYSCLFASPLYRIDRYLHDLNGDLNSHISVADINQGKHPWLKGDPEDARYRHTEVKAGISFIEFAKIMEACGGAVGRFDS